MFLMEALIYNIFTSMLNFALIVKKQQRIEVTNVA